MTEQEIRRTICNMKRMTRKICSSKAEARKFLVKAGIYTKGGRLARPYR